MIRLALARCKAVGLLLVALVMGLIYAMGRKDAKAAVQVKDAKAYRSTRKRMDATPDLDATASRAWLRARGKSGGNL